MNGIPRRISARCPDVRKSSKRIDEKSHLVYVIGHRRPQKQRYRVFGSEMSVDDVSEALLPRVEGLGDIRKIISNVRL